MAEPDDNTPEGTVAPETESSIMGDISDILDDPAEDTREDADDAADESEDAEDKEESDADEDEDAEDPDEKEGDEEEDQSDYVGGRFAPDSAKVNLADGTTTTIAELKRGFLREGDYTQKTQAVAEERKVIEQERQRVGQHTQQLDEQLQFASKWLELTKPQRPEVSYGDDPIAHGEYQDAMQRWNEAAQWIGSQINQARTAYQQQAQATAENYKKAEEEALRKAIPALRDPGRHSAFVSEAKKIASEYGIKAEELDGVYDHRQWLILRDAMAYRRLKARTPKVKQDIESKPRMVQGSRRDNSQSQTRARRNRTERLRNDGTVEAGMAAIMDIKDL